jgi:hypothetical protein
MKKIVTLITFLTFIVSSLCCLGLFVNAGTTEPKELKIVNITARTGGPGQQCVTITFNAPMTDQNGYTNVHMREEDWLNLGVYDVFGSELESDQEIIDKYNQFATVRCDIEFQGYIDGNFGYRYIANYASKDLYICQVHVRGNTISIYSQSSYKLFSKELNGKFTDNFNFILHSDFANYDGSYKLKEDVSYTYDCNAERFISGKASESNVDKISEVTEETIDNNVYQNFNVSFTKKNISGNIIPANVATSEIINGQNDSAFVSYLNSKLKINERTLPEIKTDYKNSLSTEQQSIMPEVYIYSVSADKLDTLNIKILKNANAFHNSTKDVIEIKEWFELNEVLFKDTEFFTRNTDNNSWIVFEKDYCMINSISNIITENNVQEFSIELNKIVVETAIDNAETISSIYENMYINGTKLSIFSEVTVTIADNIITVSIGEFDKLNLNGYDYITFTKDFRIPKGDPSEPSGYWFDTAQSYAYSGTEYGWVVYSSPLTYKWNGINSIGETKADGTGFEISFNSAVTDKDFINFNMSDEWINENCKSAYSAEDLARRILHKTITPILNKIIIDGNTIETISENSEIFINYSTNYLVIKFPINGFDVAVQHTLEILANGFITPNGSVLQNNVKYVFNPSDLTWSLDLGEDESVAIDIDWVKSLKTNTDGDYVSDVAFSKAPATTEATSLQNLYDEFIFINGVSVKEILANGVDSNGNKIENAVIVNWKNNETYYYLEIIISRKLYGYGLKNNENDYITIKKNFKTQTEYLLVGDVCFRTANGNGFVNYDEIDFEAVNFVGVIGPGNTVNVEFNLVFDKPITYRTLNHINADSFFKNAYFGSNNEWGYTDNELYMLTRYGVFQGSVWHKIMFNGSTIYELMKKETNPSQVTNTIQVHITGNLIKIFFNAASIIVEDGVEKDVEGVNKISDTNQKFTFTICKDFLTPNGKIVNKDTSYMYNPATKKWSLVSETDPEEIEYKDNTLDNQAGRLDSDIVSDIITKTEGCDSSFNTNSIIIIAIMLVVSLLLNVSKNNIRKQRKGR